MLVLGRVELPSSPLSGVRSSHLSYRPDGGESGGAGRDRTGDLLNANQALSQLSYSPKFNRGQLDAGTRDPVPCRFKTLPYALSGDCGTGSPKSPKTFRRFGSGTTVFYSPTLYT